jgi:hypothetical protein
MNVHLINTRTWGGRHTGTSWHSGLLSLSLRGVFLHILFSRRQYERGIDRMLAAGFSLWMACFPLPTRWFRRKP